MKCELFSSAFWGIILIVIGILLIIKYVFNIQFPIFRVVIAVIFIYIGIRIIIGGGVMNKCHTRYYSNGNQTVFSDTKQKYDAQQNNYSCVFGSSTLDLTDLKLTENKTIDISCVFGEYIIKLNKTTNYEILSSTAFGNTVTTDESSSAFGSRTYRAKDFNPTQPVLTLRTNTAFGSIKIVNEQ